MRDLEARAAAAQTQRVVSIDALRGFSIFWILGADAVVWSLNEILRDEGPWLSAVGGFFNTQMTHVAWEGFRFYDFIFPLFIFVTGVAIVLSLPRLVEREGKAQAYVRIFRRALVLYGMGLIFYGGISHHWNDVRLVGVLQRIALCYLCASLLFLNLRARGIAVALVVLLAGYWALMTFVPVPGVGAGSFAPYANLANWIDARYLPGRKWEVTRDPEGLLSTLPAIGTCLLGVLSGLLLTDSRLQGGRKSLTLIAVGIVLTAGGYLWGLQFPVIKVIWTSSFVLVAGGYSMILLGVLHQIVDVWGFSRWATVFIWLGANAIVLYFINNVTTDQFATRFAGSTVSTFELLATRFVGGDFAALLDRLITPGMGTFVVRLLGLTFAILLARFLYQRKIFLRV
ncbi:MAG: acyltransferase family protein [Bradyrhizobium sp.]|uniref:acyltransferase family protein n=1 Tax=Bradyrhizobium sp. TaxID=376 RepID=UPI003535941D